MNQTNQEKIDKTFATFFTRESPWKYIQIQSSKQRWRDVLLKTIEWSTRIKKEKFILNQPTNHLRGGDAYHDPTNNSKKNSNSVTPLRNQHKKMTQTWNNLFRQTSTIDFYTLIIHPSIHPILSMLAFFCISDDILRPGVTRPNQTYLPPLPPPPLVYSCWARDVLDLPVYLSSSSIHPSHPSIHPSIHPSPFPFFFSILFLLAPTGACSSLLLSSPVLYDTTHRFVFSSGPRPRSQLLSIVRPPS